MRSRSSFFKLLRSNPPRRSVILTSPTLVISLLYHFLTTDVGMKLLTRAPRFSDQFNGQRQPPWSSSFTPNPFSVQSGLPFGGTTGVQQQQTAHPLPQRPPAPNASLAHLLANGRPFVPTRLRAPIPIVDPATRSSSIRVGTSNIPVKFGPSVRGAVVTAPSLRPSAPVTSPSKKSYGRGSCLLYTSPSPRD